MVINASPETLLTILVLLIVGILIMVIWLVNYIAGPGIRKKSRRKRPGVQPTPGPPKEPPSAAEDAGERRSLPMGMREIMRVLRDEDTGALIVEVEGNRYRRLTEIQDGRIGNQVLQAIADLIRFTGGIVRESWATASVTPAVSTRGRSQIVAAGPPDEDEKTFFRHLKESGLQLSESPPKKAQPGLMGYFVRRQKPQAAEETGSRGTFIDEIEEILQRMVSTAPTPLGSEVHVRTGSDGGLQIQVGGQYFSSSDEVPDPAIRNLIKAAVREWERGLS